MALKVRSRKEIEKIYEDRIDELDEEEWIDSKKIIEDALSKAAGHSVDLNGFPKEIRNLTKEIKKSESTAKIHQAQNEKELNILLNDMYSTSLKLSKVALKACIPFMFDCFYKIYRTYIALKHYVGNYCDVSINALHTLQKQYNAIFAEEVQDDSNWVTYTTEHTDADGDTYTEDHEKYIGPPLQKWENSEDGKKVVEGIHKEGQAKNKTVSFWIDEHGLHIKFYDMTQIIKDSLKTAIVSAVFDLGIAILQNNGKISEKIKEEAFIGFALTTLTSAAIKVLEIGFKAFGLVFLLHWGISIMLNISNFDKIDEQYFENFKKLHKICTTSSWLKKQRPLLVELVIFTNDLIVKNGKVNAVSTCARTLTYFTCKQAGSSTVKSLLGSSATHVFRRAVGVPGLIGTGIHVVSDVCHYKIAKSEKEKKKVLKKALASKGTMLIACGLVIASGGGGLVLCGAAEVGHWIGSYLAE